MHPLRILRSLILASFPLLTLPLLFVWFLSDVAWGSPQLGIRSIQGSTETVRVPTLVEPWSATAVARPPLRVGSVHRRGHFPGFNEAKRRANAARARAQSKTTAAIPAQGDAVTAAAAATTSGLVFDGPNESDTDFFPPDPILAAGPNHVVVLINSLMAAYDKSGNLQGGFQQFSSFFGGLGLTGEIYDPRIIYDQTDNRFVLTAAEVDQVNFTSGNVLIAVSQTSDPTGVWNKFAVNFKGRDLAGAADTFPDFPTLGLSSSAVYISTGQFELNANCLRPDSCSFSDTWIKMIGLAEILSGGPALNITTFQDVRTASGFQAFAVQPALTYGSSSEEFLVGAEFSSDPGSTLNVFSINVSGAPVLSAADLTVPAFGLPPDATQPTNLPIATNDFRMLNTIWSNGSLWCGQNVAGQNGNAAARWYQIAVTSLASLALGQSGDIAGSGDAYFPAVVVTGSGDAEVVFSTSSVLQYASAAVAGRSASDAANSLRAFVIYRPGTAVYSESVALRWGDYSGASLDPNGASIWTIAEFAGSPNPAFGTAVAQITAVSAYTASSTQLDFGNQLVGYPSSPQSLTLTNSSAGSITVPPLAIGGANATEFALNADPCSNATLASGASCTVTLTFTPATTGPRSAVVTVATGPASSAVYVQLTGTGVPLTGALVLQPSALTFPDTPVRYASASQNLTLQNVSHVPLLIEQILFGEGGGFGQTNNCGTSLAAGASCTITVTFRPSSPGAYPQTLTVYSGTGSVSASVSGNATTVPVVTPCPAAVSFSNQTVGTTSAPVTVTVTNTGTDTLALTAITATGDFTQSNSCPKTLAARTACGVSVAFAPAATGVRNGTLTITDNAAGSPHTVSLNGTGTAAAASNGSSPEYRPAPQELSSGTSPAAAPSSRAEPVATAQAMRDYGRLPLTFEPNEGQADSTVRFLSRGGGYTLLLTPDEAVLKLTRMLTSKVKGRESKPPREIFDRLWPPAADRSQRIVDVLRMRLVGANPMATVEGLDPLQGTTNYFIGNDPARWRTHVASYARVRYAGIYPGVDLMYYGNQRRLEYDFVVAPGADPSQVALEIVSGMAKFGTTPSHGRPALRVDRHGDLVVRTAAGEMRLHKPVVYQIPSRANMTAKTGGAGVRRSPGRRLLKAGYVLHPGGKVSFCIPVYDHAQPLVIDPQITYSTFLGGSGQETGYGIAVDAAGSAYITGATVSPDFPTANAFQPTISQSGLPAGDVFVTKLSPDGTSFIYSTFLGGTSLDTGYAIAVDAAGSAYVTGSTLSSDFPVTKGAFQVVFGGLGNAFATKLSPDGSALMYSTYLGGTGADEGHGIAVDSGGNAYIAGTTTSPDLKVTPNAFQKTLIPINYRCPGIANCPHGFAAALNSTGSGLVYTTYLEGSNAESPQGIAVDASGDAYVTGYTASNDFPTTAGAYQTGLSLTGVNAFVTKISPQGTSLLYSTLLGGDGNPISGPNADEAYGIAVDAQGSAYITGGTESIDFPTVNPAQKNLDGGIYLDPTSGDAFVTKLHPQGCALVYSTFLGGTFDEVGRAIAVDPSGNAFVVGLTDSTDFPTVNAVQASYVSTVTFSSLEPFVTELDPTGSKFLYSTYLDGTTTDLYSSSGAYAHDYDQAYAVAVDMQGNAYVTGQTAAADFPIVNGAQARYGGQQDVFVAKLNPPASRAWSSPLRAWCLAIR